MCNVENESSNDSIGLGEISNISVRRQNASETSSEPDLENLTGKQFKRSDILLRAIDGTFFKGSCEIEGQMQIKAKCILCEPNNVEIKGYGNCTHNFASHLQRRHGNEIKNKFLLHSGGKRKKLSQSGPETEENLSIEDRQYHLNEDLVKFICHSMIPFSVIDDPFFLRFVNNFNLKNLGLSIMSRRTLMRKMDSFFENQCLKIKQTLKNVPYLCTTTDIWSSRTRSFLGVTVHWIDEKLERKSAALACRRFKNNHSYDRIACLLHSIHTEYSLDCQKIVATTTDNGSNFLKAFRVYGMNDQNILTHTQETLDIEEGQTCHFSSDSEETNSEHSEGIEEVNARNIDLKGLLPFHIKCAAHSLNLVATSDVTKLFKSDVNFSKLHFSVIKKCNFLWLSCRRPKSAEIIRTILGHMLCRPTATRWNSLYDSLKKIIEIRDKTSEVFKALGSKIILTDNDFLYLEEHLTCTRPLADAIDILQGECSSYYGITLPCILALRKKSTDLANRQWVYCVSLARTILDGIETRFQDILSFCSTSSDHATVAAFSYPRFKSKWLACLNEQDQEERLKIFKEIVAKEVVITTTSNDQHQLTATNSNSEDSSNFFDFGSSEIPSLDLDKSAAEMIILRYFNDKRDTLESLNCYPEIKRIFIKFNTPLPSSAPVERMFSLATMTNLPKSHKLSDYSFEKRVLLKANLKSFG